MVILSLRVTDIEGHRYIPNDCQIVQPVSILTACSFGVCVSGVDGLSPLQEETAWSLGCIVDKVVAVMWSANWFIFGLGFES